MKNKYINRSHLSDLNEDEIIMLGTIIKSYNHVKSQESQEGIIYVVRESIKELANKEINNPTDAINKGSRIENKYEAIALGLLRTGLFNLPTCYGTSVPSPTLLFEEFVSFCPDFDDLLDLEE